MFCTKAIAQQDAQYSQYMYGQFYLNPAAAGVNPRIIELGVIHRQQWLGYTPSFDTGGSPITTAAFITVPVKFLRGGLGIQVQNDKLGPLSITTVSAAYAFHQEIQNGTFSVGIQGGFYSLGVDFSALRPRDKDDVLLYSGDLSQVRRDFGLGLQITKKKYYIGIAANHIFQPAFAFGATTSSKLNIHTNITGGMNFDLSNDIAIKPSAIIRTDFNSFSAQVSAIASYQNFINFGLGMRNSFGVDDAILFAGINLLKDKSLHIGYAFDYVVSGVSAKAPTSHEVMVRYNIPMPISIAPIIRTPRFRF
jgi:type IX secretion system PorP/SprF family membrane protein